MKATPEEVAHYEKLALERGGTVLRPGLADEAVASCRLDGETQVVEPLRGRGRVSQHEPGRMNKTEAAHAERLELRKKAGEIAGYWFEAVKLRLADKTWLTPDFLVMLADGTLEFHEVKGGFVRDDSLVKLKVAASLYPLFRFVLCEKHRNGWTCHTVSST